MSSENLPASNTSSKSIASEGRAARDTANSKARSINSNHEPKFRSDSKSSNGQSVQTKLRYAVEMVQPAEVMYKRAAPIIRNPLVPPGPCDEIPYKPGHLNPNDCKGRHSRHQVFRTPLELSGPDRPKYAEERRYYRALIDAQSAHSDLPFYLNPAVATPIRARPFRNTRGRRVMSMSSSAKENACNKWEEVELKQKEYNDHLIAEEIGYETLVGNLLYIDIPGGRDLNRSWQNFLSEDAMEWGFPYYKGSQERPKFNHREPYLAHQLKEKLWKYPKTRLFSTLE